MKSLILIFFLLIGTLKLFSQANIDKDYYIIIDSVMQSLINDNGKMIIIPTKEIYDSNDISCIVCELNKIDDDISNYRFNEQLKEQLKPQYWSKSQLSNYKLLPEGKKIIYFRPRARIHIGGKYHNVFAWPVYDNFYRKCKISNPVFSKDKTKAIINVYYKSNEKIFIVEKRIEIWSVKTQFYAGNIIDI